MSSEIRIYVEGGGNSKETKALMRGGFGQFLCEAHEAARRCSVRWRVVAGGPRDRAFEAFQMASRSHPDAFNVLLVDSEGPVSIDPRGHLRQQDGWTAHLPDKHYHLMVQTMEAWLIADVEALRKFYGQGFQESAIPRSPRVEEIDKVQLASALDRATRNTQKGRYHKIKHGAKLLKLIDPHRVRCRARHCDRLFVTLDRVITGGSTPVPR